MATIFKGQTLLNRGGCLKNNSPGKWSRIFLIPQLGENYLPREKPPRKKGPEDPLFPWGNPTVTLDPPFEREFPRISPWGNPQTQGDLQDYTPLGLSVPTGPPFEPGMGNGLKSPFA